MTFAAKLTGVLDAAKVSVFPLTVAGPIAPTVQLEHVLEVHVAMKYCTPLTGVEGSVIVNAGDVGKLTLVETVSEK